MKELFTSSILVADEVLFEETLPITNKEFVVSLCLTAGALTLFGAIIHFFGL